MPAGGPFEENVTKVYAEELEKATNGRIKLEIYAGGSLLNFGEVYDGVVSGTADLGVDCPAWFPGRLPLTFLMEYPGIKFNSSKAASRAYDEFVKTMALEEYSEVHPLMFFCSGPGSFQTTKPVRKMEDLQGLRIRCNAANAPTVTALGGTPVTMDMSESYEGVKLGIIDGHVGAIEVLTGFNFHEVVDYCTLYPLFNACFCIVMNKDVYNSFPEDLQQAFDEVTEKIWEDLVISFFDVENAKAIEYSIEQSGLEVIELSDEEVERWRNEISFVAEEYAEDLNSKGLPAQKH
jgi:TRAP-type C4-dicarboxylate transport system substrate-binding protein